MATNPMAESAAGWGARFGRSERVGQRPVESHRSDSIPRSPTLLARLIENEIIPRLLLVHKEETCSGAATAELPIDIRILPGDIDALAPLALELDTFELLGRVRRFVERGVAVEHVFVDLIAPVARRLGEYWDEDRCDFVDVTMALWRLQEIVHELSADAPRASRTGGPPRRALFGVCPGDQHSLGTVIVDELFRCSGWDTARAGPDESIEAIVEGEAFDLVGLTVSCDSRLQTLGEMIAAIRTASRNPSVVVMVGGRVFADEPARAARVGADGTAATASQALAKAELLVQIFSRLLPGTV